MNSQPVEQTIAIHVVTNMSVNITWETFFLKNHTQNVMEKLFPDTFLKNQIEHISGSTV